MENIKSKLWSFLKTIFNAPGFLLFMIGGALYVLAIMAFGTKTKLYEMSAKLMAVSMSPERLSPIVQYTYYTSTVIWAYVIINYYIF